VLLFVLVLSIAVLVLVLGEIKYSNQTHGSASYPELPRSALGIAAVQTAIEYEYRFTEYRFAEYEYEYDEIRCEARTPVVTDVAEDHDAKNQESTGGDFGARFWYARHGH
jgi:hypothetical protein